jgi:phosphoglucosamine mutase
MTTVDSARLGKAERVVDAGGRYIEFCKSTFPMGMELRGLKLVVDCANGATYHVAPSVFRELGATVVPVAVTPNGLNINAHCGSTQPESLQAAVLREQADLGVALDGDGDRVILVDQGGNLVDGDELLFIIARARQTAGALNGAVVGTVMSNLGLELALRQLAIEFRRTPVGDRYVLDLMEQHGWTLGGESSGHIICRDRTTTGDGIVSALQVLAEMVTTGQPLHELKVPMRKLPQRLVNVRVAGKVDFREHAAIQAAVREVEAQLGERGRVLLRSSGTEPLVRVMVEGQDEGEVASLAEQLARVVATSLSA